MKNKILLTLVLLIPSLCFGKSIKVATHFDKYNKTFLIVTYITEEQQGYFKFNTNGESISVEKNMDVWIKFMKILNKHFPINKEQVNYTLKKYNPVNWYHIDLLIENLAIENNFAVTFVKDREVPKGHMTTRYFYKPEK